MRTTNVDTPEGRWTILHHGDWSGDVQLVPPDGLEGPIILPATVLLALSRGAVCSKLTCDLIAFLEQWSPRS